ncbi:N-acetyltransferase [Candidatus Entotheonella serta]|nr:N-acetyltransferase [Candidatus Entotheonella serta]
MNKPVSGKRSWPMPLTLETVATAPHIVTSEISLAAGEIVILRPLLPNDKTRLAVFFDDLSPQTREFCTYPSYDLAAAHEFCTAINRYDKLRFVVTTASEKRVIALLEYSFDIPERDQQRYASYHIVLNPKTDCRMGPCLADDYQNQGVGSLLFPYLIDVARGFGKTRIILWGGVLIHNHRAIRYYEKLGFQRLGRFKSEDDRESMDMMLEI